MSDTVKKEGWAESLRPLCVSDEVWALTVRQPCAWLIVNGWKNIENRTWGRRFSGRLFVHAAKGMTKGEYEAARIFVAGFAPMVADKMPPMKALELGGIVGETSVIACVRYHPSEWFTGPFGFVLDPEKSRPLPFVACKGALGFFRLCVVERLAASLAALGGARWSLALRRGKPAGGGE